MRTTTQQAPTPTTAALPRGGRFSLIPPTLTLALSRLRRMWRLLLVTELGLVGAVVLICAVPLFSQVAVSSGLRGALASAEGGPVLSVSAFAFQPTPDVAQQTSAKLDSLVRQHLGRYLGSGKPVFSVQTGMNATKTKPPSTGAPQGRPGDDEFGISLDGRDMSEARDHLQLLHGRLPAASTLEIEVALPDATAGPLGLKAGDMLYGLMRSASPQPNVIPLHVVGIYGPTSGSDPYWADPNGGNGRGFVAKFATGGQFSALASADTLIAVIAAQISVGGAPIQMNWRYPLALDRIAADDLDPLAEQYGQLADQLNNQLSGQRGVQGVNLGGALQSMAEYRARAVGLLVVIIILLLQVLGLALLFVSLMAGILVERQSEAIALLRSRGAHRRQVLGALALQGLGASAIALIAGPFLAIPLVRLIAGQLLPPAAQSGITLLERDPFALAWGLRWYALVTVIAAAVAIVVAIIQAANRNVLALRRESAREGAPLWQRLNLDLIGALFLLAIYGLYLWGIQQVGPIIRLGLSALGIIMPLLLLVAIALLFGRIFPLALRLSARGAARRSGAAPMLALAHMARAPRQSSRMLLLLALATAFAIFTLVLTVSQVEHVRETVAFHTVADYSGTLRSSLTTPDAPAKRPTVADLTKRYAGILGVTSASIGYQRESSPQGQPPARIVAVDPETYARTVIWSAGYSEQSPEALTRMLADHRAAAQADGVVSAVVDDALWKQLTIGDDGQFTLTFDGHDGRIRFQVVARVAHIPPIVNTADLGIGSGAALVDYDTFAVVYTRGQATTVSAPAPNTVWLRSADDLGSQAAVRAGITTGALAVSDFLDRRQILADTASNPLQLDLTGALGLGAGTALALALVGAWTASWLNARSRLTSFAVLRALGTTPRQILSLLLWEQGIVYVTALGLGLGLGLLLAQTALPALIFTSAIARTASATNGDFSPIDVPAARIIIPINEMGLVLGGLAVISVIAVAITTFIISRASLGEALRLNQD